MKKRLFIGCLCCLMAILAGCNDDDLPYTAPNCGQTETGGPMDAVFRIRIAFEENIRPRTADPAEDETPGNDMERSIHTLHLFAVPLVTLPDGTEQEDWAQVSQGNATLHAPVNSADASIDVPIHLKASGKMHLYVGANLSRGQISSFLNKKDYYKVKGEKYYQAINEFAPFITNDASVNRNPENIAMFCHQATPVAADIDKEENGESPGSKADEDVTVIPVPTPVELRRMVAKVLVTCETEEKNGIHYMKLKNDLVNDGNDPLGWIRQENVYYFVNSMPRKTQFIQAHSQGGAGELQPHYNMKEALKTLTYSLVPLSFKEDEINDNFIHYDMLELHERNSSFQRSSVWSDEEYNKLIGNTPGTSAYSRPKTGMYTLENLYDMQNEEFTETELTQLWEYEALPMITHTSIAAKFTPKYLFATKEEWEGANGLPAMKEQIVVTADGTSKPLREWVETTEVPQVGDLPTFMRLTCQNEEAAWKILTHSLERKGKLWQEGEGDGIFHPDKNPDGRFPAETFFAYHMGDEGSNSISYCTYGVAVSFGTVGKVDESMVPYTNGWGYYYTYINNHEEAAITAKEQLKDACVERNHYYILRVTSIGTMGATITDPKYMRVHTLKAEWQDGGKGDITLN